ncbi:hypothetical protein RHMOL_Rhmol11G0171000 [Rhododendron molle]|uniref:Uncharacterized protein n=1 Tax=Rhododendron molle TaxID=49168 RepID=A0ACC0LU44_RHOML|nr:hypothetical protein RHMOL_Rhmol11G0171000 [Rhododendron molle]
MRAMETPRVLSPGICITFASVTVKPTTLLADIGIARPTKKKSFALKLALQAKPFIFTAINQHAIRTKTPPPSHHNNRHPKPPPLVARRRSDHPTSYDKYHHHQTSATLLAVAANHHQQPFEQQHFHYKQTSDDLNLAFLETQIFLLFISHIMSSTWLIVTMKFYF